jgi:alpha-beta hydrolase superfamily lysophospholipase
MMIDRRAMLAGGLALGIAAPAFAKGETTVVSEERTLTVGTRKTKMLVTWPERQVRGVALFSTGHGSWPQRYQRLIAILAVNGYASYAPVHVDSMHHPDVAKFTREASFGERLADMAAAAATAARDHPGLPVIAVGHSFGTLTALCLAGGLDYLGAFRNPAVGAVLGFSTPGKIPGLVQPSAYAKVNVPVMIVTGTADTVPGLVTNPADHLFPAESAPAGGKFGLVLDGGTHELVAGTEPGFNRALPAVELFLKGYGLGRKPARAKLVAWRAAPADRFLVREAAK